MILFKSLKSFLIADVICAERWNKFLETDLIRAVFLLHNKNKKKVFAQRFIKLTNKIKFPVSQIFIYQTCTFD